MIVKPEGPGYTAVSTVDADGRIVREGQDEIALSYLGLERVPFARTGGKLAPSGALLPTLGEIVAALQARTVAFQRRDAAAYEGLLAEGYADPRATRAELLARLKRDFQGAAGLSLTVRGWTIRNEREQAEVLEEYDAVVGPSKEVHHGRARYVLRRERGAFRFLSGLM